MTSTPSHSVLIVGAGGLGVPAASALAHAGDLHAGDLKVGLLDPDPVELSNLHRQVIYGVADIGVPKVDAAARWLRQWRRLQVEPLRYGLDADNARSLIEAYDFVIDGTDNPLTKFLINDICLATGRPFVYGGVLGMTGQAMTVVPGRTACLRCLFEEPPAEGEIANCRDAGIIGPVAAAIGEAQTADALSWLRGDEPALAGRILTYDASGPGRVRLTPIAPRPGCGCGAAERAASAIT